MDASNDAKWQLFSVQLDLSEKGLGMSIRGGCDSPDDSGNIDIYVSRILQGGAVHQDGRIQLGDILLEVNGLSLTNINHKSAVENILNAAPYISFRVKRPKYTSNSSDIHEQIEEETEDEPLLAREEKSNNLTMFNNTSNDCIKVELMRDDNGFGFSLSGGSDNQLTPGDTRLVVSKLVQNGPAHLNGLIQIGDQIAAINNTSLERVPYSWALNLIRSSPSISIFTVKKAVTWD